MSAVVKEKPVETIFDYDLTDEERASLTFGIDEQEYLDTHDEESINKGLMFLFAMRNDSDKANFYMSKLDKDWVKLNLKWDKLFSSID